MKLAQKFGPKATNQVVCRAWAFGEAESAATANFKSAESGTFLNRSTAYPAFLSISSRSASRAFFDRCDASSSSIAAIASKPFVSKTKSATLRSNVFLADCDLASSNAENATCAKTTWSGKVSVSRKNIDCSRSVSGARFVGVSVDLPVAAGFFFASATPIAAMTAIPSIGKSKSVTRGNVCSRYVLNSVANGSARGASGDAGGTPAGGAGAVPLGNTGTTTVEGAR